VVTRVRRCTSKNIFYYNQFGNDWLKRSRSVCSSARHSFIAVTR
jgi:hypothetical protein